MKQASEMILSSADIQRILGGDPIIRQEARISIVDTKPGFGLDEYVYIYIERYPAVDEFEATWRVWVHNGGSDVLDLVLAAMTRLLPKFEFQREGLYSTTDFKSDRTVVRPAEEIALEKVAQATGTIEQRFAALEQLALARLAAIRNGIDGKDGLDGLTGAPGAPGRDGRDGRDLVATEADLEDLQNVEQNIAKEDGQVLTWKDGVWQNLFIPQVVSSIAPMGANGGTSPVQVLGTTIQWRFHSTPHEIEPDPGDFHTDNADGELVTVIHVSKTNSSGNDIDLLLGELLEQGYNRIYVSQETDPSQAHLYSVSSYVETTSGYEITVSHIQTGGTEPGYIQPRVYGFLFLPATAGGGWVEEAPEDGNYYVRQNGAWIDLATALDAIAGDGTIIDGGIAT